MKLIKAKRIIHLTLLFYFPLMVFSQEKQYEYISFPTTDAIWSEIYYYAYPCDTCPRYSFERFALNGEDTVINKIVYKKLYLFYDSDFDKTKATCVGGIREDEYKHIYFKSDTFIHSYKPDESVKNDENEYLLYDFSKEIGDSIIFRGPPNDITLVISEIDTIQIGDSYRKKFKFKDSPTEWIEGIGNTMGLLYTSTSFPTNDVDGFLICFKQNGNILYFTEKFNDCFPSTNSIESVKNNHEIFIHLNSDRSITFEFRQIAVSTIQIYDCSGKLLNNYKVGEQTVFVLPSMKYQSGTYFYRIYSKNKIFYTGKFIR